MNYEKGDKVLYKEIEHVDKTCECCGHEDYDLVTKKVKGIIEKVKLEFVYNLYSGFTTDEVITKEDGTLVHKPYLPDPVLNKKETVYKINGSWLTKDALLEKI